MSPLRADGAEARQPTGSSGRGLGDRGDWRCFDWRRVGRDYRPGAEGASGAAAQVLVLTRPLMLTLLIANAAPLLTRGLQMGESANGQRDEKHRIRALIAGVIGQR